MTIRRVVGLVLLGLSGCGGQTQDDPTLTCGAGTHAEDGACVPDDVPDEPDAGAPDAEVPEPEPDAAVEDELPVGVYPLDTLEVVADDSDLAPLAAIVGDASVVALGESIHTSGGYSQAKFRLFTDLVENLGFRVFAFESPRTQAELVRDYVATCEGTPEDAIRGLFGVWANTSVRDLLVWMCGWNEEHPDDPVAFFGFDVQQPWDDAAAWRAFVDRAAPEEAESLSAAIDGCDGTAYPDATAYYQDHPDLAVISDEDYEACLEGVGGAEEWIAEHRDALVVATGEHDVRSAELALVGIRSWEGEAKFFTSDVPASYEARDVAMAEVFETIWGLDYPGARVAIWAHNWHIAHHADRMRGYLLGTHDMGSFLKEDLGDDYQAIGLVGYDVSINWPGVGQGPIGLPTAADAVEVILHALGRELLLVDLAFPGAAEPLLAPGEEYELGGAGEHMVPAEQYRALVYLDASPGMEALWW